ncbi:MAG: SLATT domain-containing protein [Methanomassiliicoccus sp.]|nr:SLATT domain-containing protein [Methanomassiliicoccus sp.]
MALDMVEFQKDVLDLEERCQRSRASHFIDANRWTNANWWLGVFSIVLGALGGTATASTAGGGSDALVIPFAVGFSFLAGVIGAVVSFLKPEEKASAHKRAGDGWSILADKFFKLARTDISLKQPDELSKMLDDLIAEKQRVTEASPVISQKARVGVSDKNSKDLRASTFQVGKVTGRIKQI